MTWPDHLLTLEEWDELPEDVSRRFELVDGVLQMSPRPTPAHQRLAKRLMAQLDPQLAEHGLECLSEVDVVLAAGFPPVLRSPGIVVTESQTLDARPARLSAGDARLVVEAVSPGSARIDRVAKMAEYAEAGIPHYWIVDVAESVTLDTFSLAGTTFRPAITRATGSVTLSEPASLTIDLTALRP
jgi:Uma2 family endonuclease